MKKIILLFLFSIIISSCSSTKDSLLENSKAGNDYYVFDDVDMIDSLENSKDNVINSDTIKSETKIAIQKDSSVVLKFIIQLGAFSTKERADNFIKENQDKISYMMSTIYNSKNRLYVVQLPAFRERSEAEVVRNELLKIPAFNGAFIISE